MKYGNIVPGKLNISTWFRKINPEFVLKKGINEFEIDAGEDIAYLTFNTSKKCKTDNKEANQNPGQCNFVTEKLQEFLVTNGL
jgi:hypothetical protein